jgi:hypothetical protein
MIQGVAFGKTNKKTNSFSLIENQTAKFDRWNLKGQVQIVVWQVASQIAYHFSGHQGGSPEPRRIHVLCQLRCCPSIAEPLFIERVDSIAEQLKISRLSPEDVSRYTRKNLPVFVSRD